MKMRVSNLTKRELETAISEANLTPLQTRIVYALNREELTDEGIMMDLHVCRETYYREKKLALSKISRTFAES